MIHSIVTSLLISLTLQPSADNLPGTYRASLGDEVCQLLFMPPATTPSSSLLQVQSVSGLAIADSACALDVAEAALWVVTEDELGPVLSLTGFSGDVLWSGRRDETGGWINGDEAPVRLTREGS